jgi:histidinol dehydrogenase
MKIDSIKNRRSREKGILIYPVYSRRSQGLSLGINLFPDRKVCSFDCPYCEVFPFFTRTMFNHDIMEEELRSAIAAAQEQNTEIKDICFSGNGEPSLSPHFPEALEKAFFIRDNLIPEAKLVLITNGTGLLHKNLFELLAGKAKRGLCIWLKVDAGTEEWFSKIDRPQGCDFLILLNRIRDFSVAAPFTIQTMICKVGTLAPQEEEEAWVNLIIDLASPGNLKAVQIYGKARPSPEDPLAEAVDSALLLKRAEILRLALQSVNLKIPVEVFP